jgi:hypothetical protein
VSMSVSASVRGSRPRTSSDGARLPRICFNRQSGTLRLVRLKVRTNNEVEVLIGQTLAVRS